MSCLAGPKSVRGSDGPLCNSDHLQAPDVGASRPSPSRPVWHEALPDFLVPLLVEAPIRARIQATSARRASFVLPTPVAPIPPELWPSWDRARPPSRATPARL